MASPPKLVCVSRLRDVKTCQSAQALKLSRISRRRLSLLAHCLSLADTTNRKARSPLTVVAVSECGPTLAYCALSSYR